MKIQFDFNKCIYCIENEADSWEHIIPDSIGGRLQAKMLCTDCNSKLGSTLISKVKTDPSIRLAVGHLESDIPELFEAIENNQLYVTKDNNNDVIRLKYKNSRLEIGESSTNTRLPVIFDWMMLEELLAKAFWITLIITSPGMRKSV